MSFKNWFRKTFIGRLWTRYNDHIKLLTTSGHTAKVQNWMLRPTRLIMRIWRWLQLGSIKVVGAENLAIKERVIFCPNHSSYFDAIVMLPSHTGVLRYMGAYEEFKGFLGLRTLIMTGIGGFPVDRARGKTVIKPATKLLVDGERLMIFPEGKIYNSGVFGPFKMGPAVIAMAARNELKNDEPVGIVPIHICYHKRNVKTGETYSFWKMGFSWRGGVTIYVGKPIWLHEHSNLNPEQLMALVRSRMAEFKCSTSGEAGTFCST